MPHEVELASLKSGIGFGRFDVGDGSVSGVKDRALVGGGKVAGIEVIETAGRNEPSVEDDESREVLVVGAEAVADPGSHTGTSLQTGTGVEKVVRRGVLGKLGSHRFDEGEVVGNLGDMREKVAHPGTGFAVLLEGPGGLHDLADVVELGRLEFADGLARVLSVVFFQEGFVVEGVDVGRSAIHVEEDDVLGLGSVVGLLWGERIAWGVVGSLTVGAIAHEGGKGDGPESAGGLVEHLAAGDRRGAEVMTMHGDKRLGVDQFRKMNSLVFQSEWAKSCQATLGFGWV